MKKDVIIIGYSGHSYVVIDILITNGYRVVAYCENEEKIKNPYQLEYLGKESDDLLKNQHYFIAIGNGQIRKNIQQRLGQEINGPINVIHPSAVVSEQTKMGKGVLVAAGVIVNPFTEIGDGVICNSGAIIEHECKIGAYSHIAPGATLCGDVSIGNDVHIGANAVVKEGIKIGNNVMIGAGAVIVKDISDNKKIIGNPQRELK